MKKLAQTFTVYCVAVVLASCAATSSKRKASSLDAASASKQTAKIDGDRLTITGTAENDVFNVNPEEFPHTTIVEGLGGVNTLILPGHREYFQAYFTNGNVVLFDIHSTGAQIILKNISRVQFETDVGKTYLATPTSLILEEEPNPPVLCTNTNSNLTPSEDRLTNIRLFPRQVLNIEGTGTETIIFREHIEYFERMTVKGGVLQMVEGHGTGARIRIKNVSHVMIDGPGKIYKIGRDSLILAYPMYGSANYTPSLRADPLLACPN